MPELFPDLLDDQLGRDLLVLVYEAMPGDAADDMDRALPVVDALLKRYSLHPREES